MNINIPDAKDRLQDIMFRTELPDIAIGYYEAAEQYAQVCVRDTLIDFGVRFAEATRLARLNKGGAAPRLELCVAQYNNEHQERGK